MKKRTPLISGYIFICSNGVHLSVSIHLSFRVGHVSVWHMYLTGWDLILFLLSYFLLNMVSVMNDLHCHKKVVTYLTKILKWLLWYNYKINNFPITLYTSANVLRNCWFSQKGCLKISQISCFLVGSAEFLRIHFF